MKKVIMALLIVLILIVMILSLTCPISYSYHTSYVKISGVGTIKNDRSGEYSYYLKDDLGISSGGAIAIVVIFCALAIAGIVFLYKSKDLRVYSYYGMIIATIACALVPSIMAIVCSAMNKGDGENEFTSVGGAVSSSSNHHGLEAAGVAIIILTILAMIVFVVQLVKIQNGTSLSKKQIEKAKAEVTEDNWLS